MIVGAVRTVLGTFASVTADVSTRIYPLSLPETATLPAVILQEVTHKQEYSLDHFSRVQITAIAETGTECGYDVVHRIQDNIRAGFMPYQGGVINEVIHIGDVEMMDDAGRFLIHSDYYVNWS